MKAVISVIGKDTVGILAKVSAKCAEYNVNIDDVTQTVMQDIFTMIMMADTSKCSVDFNSFKSQMKDLGESMGMKIDVMHEDIFNSMHRIQFSRRYRVMLNMKDIMETITMIQEEHLIAGKYILAQSGKKNYYLVIVK